ncbi:unnamed protein product [Parnassius apollo]|uniref:(apollo) hypothetical protein n=1 Tax=Parnassius apollo TaxID=110799 RepID=A0A8S3WW98_PARAO|nr:unnamed protein product [Parnassius apollo]
MATNTSTSDRLTSSVHRQPVLLTKNIAGKESTPGDVTHTTPPTRTVEASVPHQEESHPTPQIQEKSIAVKTCLNEGSIPTSREKSLQQPNPKKTTCDPDTLSVRSSHRKRAEVQAKMTMELRELELAEARSKVAQAELELLTAESEEEDGAGEELFERTREVGRWFIKTGDMPNKNHKPIEAEEKKIDIQELASVILKLSEKSRDTISPKHLEFSHFNGACEEWLAFKRSYEDMATSFSNNRNLARLRIAI